MEGNIGLRKPKQGDIRLYLWQYVIKQHTPGEFNPRYIWYLCGRCSAHGFTHAARCFAFRIFNIPTKRTKAFCRWVKQPRCPRRAGADKRKAQAMRCKAFRQAGALQWRFGTGREHKHILNQLCSQQAIRRHRRIK
jgi:hypothetical protein